MGGRGKMAKDTERWDKIQEVLTDIKVSQGRMEVKLDTVIEKQKTHEFELNDPEGKVPCIEKDVTTLKGKLGEILIYFGLIGVAIVLGINVALDWLKTFIK